MLHFCVFFSKGTLYFAVRKVFLAIVSTHCDLDELQLLGARAEVVHEPEGAGSRGPETERRTDKLVTEPATRAPTTALLLTFY